MADETRARPARALLSAVLACALLAGQAAHAPPAEAQQRRGLLDMLFGGGRGEARQPPQRVDPPPQRRQVKKVRKPRRDAGSAGRSRSDRTAAAAGAAAGAAAVAAPVEKSETARTVLVIGDFMAGSLAKGLEEAVSQNREIRVVSKVDGSSGLVRDDHFDWPAEIGQAIADSKPAVVVVMLGANDRQAIREAGTSLGLRTTEWSERYDARVEALAAAVRAGGATLVWVGALPFGIDRANEDMVYFNDLYRTAALKAGGEFVDVWGGFTDANGAFTASGPDMTGQTARLRNSDGITLTGAGQDKLAYFVEKPVTRVLGLSVDDLVASLGAQQLSADDLPSVDDLASTTSTPPVSFSDPSLDGGDRLLGGGPAPAAASGTDASPRARLVVAGAPHDPTEGRADHFNWTGRAGAVSPTTRDNAIVFRGSTTLDELRRQAKDAAAPEAADAADAAARNLSPPTAP
ncbi:DUF459 domain-containing protein [Aureimonas flava]|uniref:DUF459 domain-containing protein n=1 Tax=Aureimonas flava TaxID=2320271 RepID=A0A3A1WKX5_9HYPH|nr:SGNH family hydrolase [Aureimonas flava]RIY00899.1 DUF459 domain-containing protein [Aureimonas flava]